MGPRVFAFHKPLGAEVTRPKTLKGRTEGPSVYHLLPHEFHSERWMPVGRLDKDSSGLLLFVREGRLVARLQEPGAHDKVYEVTVRGPVEPDHLVALHEGVGTALGVLKVGKAEILGTEGKLSRLWITLGEGKNRHLRRLFNGLRDGRLHKPLKVMALKRVRFGTVGLDLEEGRWRFLERAEEERLLG